MQEWNDLDSVNRSMLNIVLKDEYTLWPPQPSTQPMTSDLREPLTDDWI